MAHTDVVPADPAQWSVDPFAATSLNGVIYGRGAEDDLSLLAAEMAVLVELKRRKVPLQRDIILLAEADEEAGSTGIQWLIQKAWHKIDAEFALNEGGFVMDHSTRTRIFHIQTAEKVPTRIKLTARGTAGHGSMPRPDNPVARLARAITRLVETDQPVRLTATTRRYLREFSTVPGYEWLRPLLPKLSSESAAAAANQIRMREPGMEAMIRTTVSPTMLNAGTKINVIPNIAEAQLDVRRIPNESGSEVLARFRRIINDSAVEITSAGGQQMPATEPSSVTTVLYQAIEKTALRRYPKALVVPYMVRGATDGAFLREKGMAVYGVPLFVKDGESRAHGNDERISIASLAAGTEMLWDIVLAVAANDNVRLD
jgi:acetylornithine deacetylase/succinyl-diaminopimelate desuccinylase-like protein